MSWKDHAFEIPLETVFPETRVSTGLDWISDCEEDRVFDLDPACFASKNQYDAALKLCKVCAGWYYFEDEKQKYDCIHIMRAVVKATPEEPMWYYSVWRDAFDWVAALKDHHPRYQNQLYDVTTLWELFQRLLQRSCLEKADAFQWLLEFFGDYMQYDSRRELQDAFVQCYDGHLELVFYLQPEYITLLTEGFTAISASQAGSLASTAAGLIRLGKKDLGIELYSKLFEMVWSGKTSTDEKKSVIDNFLNRLSAGYQDEPYIDTEIASVLEKQCAKYSDAKWVAKIKTTVGRNRI